MKVEAIDLWLYVVRLGFTAGAHEYYLCLDYTITDGLEVSRICGRVPGVPPLSFWDRRKAGRLAKRLYWTEQARRNDEALREAAAAAMKKRGFVS